MKNSRSWMFVPGHITKMVRKAGTLPTDAIMLDIEDAVLPAFKPEARKVIADEVPNMPRGEQVRYVRVNAITLKDFTEDIAAIAHLDITGIVLPKVESADEVLAAVSVIEKAEKGNRKAAPLRIMVAIETARGIIAAPAIAGASRRISALMLGAEDLGRDIGLPAQRVGEAHELLYARSALVMAASASRLQSVDQVWPNLDDGDGLIKDTLQARRLGFTGKAIIHPSQIAPTNNCFMPTAADVEFAKAVIEAFREAEGRGLGAVAFGGQLLDKPIVDRARAVLELSGKK